VVVVAAGDIVCGPTTPAHAQCEHAATAGLIGQLGPQAVLALGDEQYETGLYQDFLAYYHPTWGAYKTITRPVPGNHEYQSSGAATGYFDYFNGPGNASGPAGQRGQGYYSFDLGAWHIVALNSVCTPVGGCQAGSAQEQWLRQDLAAHNNGCTLAFMHHPRFSSGGHGNQAIVADLWQALYDGGADVVLAGNDHNYERFLPQTPAGQVDLSRGLLSFVVGTGGKNLTGPYHWAANSAVFDSSSFGVLKLTLFDGSYNWQFVSAAGGGNADTGQGNCH
jgi:hypothetical protein